MHIEADPILTGVAVGAIVAFALVWTFRRGRRS
jgi:hypothetical protein